MLQNRSAIVLSAVFTSYLSGLAWLQISRAPQFPQTVFDIFILAYCIFVGVAISYRSPLIEDKVVFGIAAAAFVVTGIRALFSDPEVLLGLAAIKALMWSIAALTSFVLLGRLLSARPSEQ
jgi:hypothetical protein